MKLEVALWVAFAAMVLFDAASAAEKSKKAKKPDQGSILQNTFSAEKFSDEFSSSNLDKFPSKNNRLNFF
jgi:hypothetical protein